MKQNNNYAIFYFSHNFSAIQQKMWCFMLFFANSNIRSEKEYKISIATLVNYLNVKSSHDIKDRLLAMHSEEERCFEYYFKKISLVGDSVIYKYPEHLVDLLNRTYALT